MTHSDSIQFVVAIFTFWGVLTALKISNKEIKNANKQALFDKRLEIFMMAEGFRHLINGNNTVLKIPDEADQMNGMYFRDMINSTYLNDLVDVIPEPINKKGPSPIDNPIAQRNFLIKKEEILKSAQAADLIFEQPESRIISKFTEDYIMLLDGRRRYEITLKEYYKQEELQQRKKSDLTTEEFFKKHTSEEERRRELLVAPIKNLKTSYADYCAKQEEIKKQISLI